MPQSERELQSHLQHASNLISIAEKRLSSRMPHSTDGQPVTLSHCVYAALNPLPGIVIKASSQPSSEAAPVYQLHVPAFQSLQAPYVASEQLALSPAARYARHLSATLSQGAVEYLQDHKLRADGRRGSTVPYAIGRGISGALDCEQNDGDGDGDERLPTRNRCEA